MRSCFPVKIVSILIFCLLLLLIISQTALAKNEAAPVPFAVGDIQFCPKGKPYLHPSCSPVRLTMPSAITDARNAAAAGISGTIYVEGGIYGSGIIGVTGFTYGTSLTIQGGVNTGTTTISRELYINGNDLDLTIRDVTFNHSAASENGFYAFSNIGDLVLENVYATVGDGHGIYIYSQAGDVSMTNVASSGNHDAGVIAQFIEGEVKLNGVDSNGNGEVNIAVASVSGSLEMNNITAISSAAGYGIFIEDVMGKKGVTITGASANSNFITNINIDTVQGNVSLIDVQAHGSSGPTPNYGIYIKDVIGNKGVTLNRVSANSNVDGNIYIESLAGNVSLTDINAQSGYFGVFCTSIAGSKGVTMKNVYANSNSYDNVNVYNIAGSVNITNVQAHGSFNEHGLIVTGIDGSKGVNLKEVYANSNALTNVEINDIESNATASAVQANGSDNNFGVYVGDIRGNKGVVLKDIEAHSNQASGIRLINITSNANLSGIDANGNHAHGVQISAVSGIKGVSIKDAYASGNSLNNVLVETIYGNVDLKGVTTYSSTSESGIRLEDISGTKGATLKTIVSEGNAVDNIAIVNMTNGNASLSGVQSVGAGNDGIHIETIVGSGSKGVLLKDIISNSCADINVYIKDISGKVDLKKVQANGSITDVGIQITNVAGSKGVSLKDVIANGNFNPNIVIATIYANVSISKAQADAGSYYGIYIFGVNGNKGVSLKDVITSSNLNDNLYISSINPGDVVLNKVTANESVSERGLYASNITGEIMVLNSFFNDNGKHGLITANVDGLIMLKGVQGNDNDTNNGATLSSSNFQLVCSSQFINNAAYGIVGDTPGFSLTIAGTDLTSTPNVMGGEDHSFGTTVEYSSKCKVIPPSP